MEINTQTHNIKNFLNTHNIKFFKVIFFNIKIFVFKNKNIILEVQSLGGLRCGDYIQKKCTTPKIFNKSIYKLINFLIR